MVDVAALATVATNLITENGRTVTLRKRAQTSSSTPWNASDTSTTVSVVAAFTSDVARLFGGTLIRRAGREAWVPAGSGTDLDTYSELIDGSTVYKIVDVERVAPNDVLAAWRLILER